MLLGCMAWSKTFQVFQLEAWQKTGIERDDPRNPEFDLEP